MPFYLKQTLQIMDCKVGSVEMPYCPMPIDVYHNPQSNDLENVKIKIYNPSDSISSIRSEFETLAALQYTHIVNMPGNLDAIIELAKFFKIIYLDWRMLRYISDVADADALV